MNESGDAQLVGKAKNGCPQATLALWERHRGLVVALLSAHGVRPAELEDLSQEVALRYCRGIGGIQDPSCFRAWLRRIAINVAHSAARRCGQERQRSEATPPEAPDGRQALRLLREEEEEEMVRDWAETALSLVDELALKYREPLLLRAVEGLSQREIAQALELPETTIESRIARARKILRERFSAVKDKNPGIPSEGRDRYAK